MRILLQIISLAGLLLTLVPAILYYQEKVTLEMVHQTMFIGFFVWFASAIFWLGKKKKVKESDEE